MTEQSYGGLTQLGHHVEQPASPDAAILERVANPSRGKNYVVRFTCPEFTSICPITGQPDFAHIVIDYIPRDWIVESKSLKLYLTSFRNHGAFHEACTMAIAEKLVTLLDPAWLRIVVECLPLQHGIELMRGLNAGVFSWSLVGDVAYFVAMAIVGLIVTARRLDALLLR